jgi:hypothetical protein
LQPLGRQFEKKKSRLRRSAPQRYRGDLDGLAGNGGALVGGSFGVAQYHRDALQRHVQLFGDDLRERCSHTRAEVDVTIERGDAAICGQEKKQLGVTAGHRPHDAQGTGALELAGARRRRVL